MELAPRLDLAGDNLLACLCPERNWLPYWHMVVDAERRAEYQFRPHCNGHNVGRWWNTMLRLERSTGYAIPPQIEAAMLDHTWRMCDNPCGILLDDPDPEQVHTWYLHSYRETMLALGLLVETRKSERAHRQGLRAIDCMRRATADLERWDLCRCEGGPDIHRATKRRPLHARARHRGSHLLLSGHWGGGGVYRSPPPGGLPRGAYPDSRRQPRGRLRPSHPFLPQHGSGPRTGGAARW